MFKNIIVPIDIDQSEQAEGVLDKAKQLVDQGGGVTLVYVVEDVPGLITAELPDGLVQSAAHNGRSKLVEMAEAAGLTADVQVRSGRPHHAIVSLADEVEADLILIRSHRPGLRQYVLGSTAASVVHHAKCAVLVVR